jgi:DNA repair exonuclease SbcCD nuclease subunit
MINILCAHGDIPSARSTYCPITVREIEEFGADYAALGHVHNPAEYTDRIAYCGCLEGRSFDETGHKGARFVTIDGKSIISQKIRFSKRRYENETLRVDGAASNTELRERIAAFVTEKHYGDDTILRLTLTGETDPAFTLNRAVLESDVPRLFSLKIVDETSPMLDAAALRLDPTLKGEFFRLLEPALTGEDPEARAVAADALRMGLSALAGEAIV